MQTNAANTEYLVTRDNGPAIASEIVLYAVPALMAVGLVLRHDSLSDLGWQLKLGEEIFQNRTPIIYEHFAIGHLNERLVPNSWLAQVVFYLIKKIGGITLLHALNAALWLSGFILVAYPAWRRGERALAITIAFSAAFAVAVPAAIIRPQSFACLAFGLSLILVQRLNSCRQAVILGAPLFVLWQNFHPSVSLAVAMTGALAADAWIKRLAMKDGDPLPMSVLCLVAFVSTFATPAGLDLIPMAAYNAKTSIQMGASEWFPIWYADNQTYFWPAIAVALLAAGVAYRRRAPSREFIPAAVMFALSLLAMRFIVFFAIAVIPILARIPVGQLPTYRSRSIAAVSITVSLLILILVPFRMDVLVPSDKMARLKPGSTIYSDTFVGGEMVDRGFKIVQDGRYYLYSQAELSQFVRSRSDGTVFAEIEKHYVPAAYVLSYHRNAALIEAIEKEGILRKTYANKNWALFVREPDHPEKSGPL